MISLITEVFVFKMLTILINPMSIKKESLDYKCKFFSQWLLPVVELIS